MDRDIFDIRYDGLRSTHCNEFNEYLNVDQESDELREHVKVWEEDGAAAEPGPHLSSHCKEINQSIQFIHF